MVEIGDQVVGMVVDGVSEVLRVNTATIEPPSPVVAGIDSEYLQGIAKLPERLVILLDLDRVLAREERRALDEPEQQRVAAGALSVLKAQAVQLIHQRVSEDTWPAHVVCVL